MNTKHQTCLTYNLNRSSFRSTLQYRSSIFRFFEVLIRGWLLFRQVILALLPILLMLTSYCSQALTAKTRNVINGHAPYLTFDGGYTRATNIDELLGITLSDGTIITRATNNSSASNPIELPNAGETFADIGMFMPTDINADRVYFGTLIRPPYNYADDDDGDDNFSTDGSHFYLLIYDRNNYRVARNETLNICNAPYRVELRTDYRSSLTTRSGGIPNGTRYDAGRATYFIKPKGEEGPRVCFAKPSLSAGTGSYAGPSSEWDVHYGFIPQSNNSSSYHRNFPTTGANNLYFDLLIGNSGPLNWGDPITQGGITVTMTPDVTGEKVRVTLTGPFAKSEQLAQNNSEQVDKPTLPQTFELVGRDNSGQAVVKYGFELKQWFVNRGSYFQSQYGTSHTLWCNNIGYRLSSIADLTNAVGRGYIGATPSSPDNHYQRRIGAGLFTEWGSMPTYAGVGFTYAGPYLSSSRVVVVNSKDGSIDNASSFPYGVCVSP